LAKNYLRNYNEEWKTKNKSGLEMKLEDLKKMALLVQNIIEVNIHFYDSRSDRY